MDRTYKKKRAAVLAHRDAKVHANTLKSSIPAAWRGVKYLAGMMGSAFAMLIGVWFFCAPFEDDAMSWSASVALMGVCVWIAVTLYHVADEEADK